MFGWVFCRGISNQRTLLADFVKPQSHAWGITFAVCVGDPARTRRCGGDAPRTCPDRQNCRLKPRPSSRYRKLEWTERQDFPESDTACSGGKNAANGRLGKYGFRGLVLDDGELLKDRWPRGTPRLSRVWARARTDPEDPHAPRRTARARRMTLETASLARCSCIRVQISRASACRRCCHSGGERGLARSSMS